VYARSGNARAVPDHAACLCRPSVGNRTFAGGGADRSPRGGHTVTGDASHVPSDVKNKFPGPDQTVYPKDVLEIMKTSGAEHRHGGRDCARRRSLFRTTAPHHRVRHFLPRYVLVTSAVNHWYRSPAPAIYSADDDRQNPECTRQTNRQRQVNGGGGISIHVGVLSAYTITYLLNQSMKPVVTSLLFFRAVLAP
jgi:hypothetical protein